MTSIEQGLQALAQTTFDPTLTQLQAELFMKENAAMTAARALNAAGGKIAEQAREIETLKARVAELEGQQAQDADETAKTNARVESVVADMVVQKPPADIAARRANGVKA